MVQQLGKSTQLYSPRNQIAEPRQWWVISSTLMIFVLPKIVSAIWQGTGTSSPASISTAFFRLQRLSQRFSFSILGRAKRTQESQWRSDELILWLFIYKKGFKFKLQKTKTFLGYCFITKFLKLTLNYQHLNISYNGGKPIMYNSLFTIVSPLFPFIMCEFKGSLLQFSTLKCVYSGPVLHM